MGSLELHKVGKRRPGIPKIIDKKLAKGEKLFPKIQENFKLAKVHLKKVLAARSEALDENAGKLERFTRADEELKNLGYALEDKNINKLIEQKSEVQELFVKAEIEAIQNKELKGANELITITREMSSHKYFEKEEERAAKDFKSAFILIGKFKDSPARYMDAVKTAEKSASRFFALASTGKWVENSNPREIVYRLDRDLNNVLKPLAYDSTEYMTYKDKMALISNETGSIPFLLNELDAVQYDSYLQHKNVLKLKKKNKKITKKLAKKNEVQENLKKIRSMFNNDEAKVFVQGDDLIIRLVGLNFESDKAKLPKGSQKILKKVGNTAKTLSYPEIKIIGHADSKGDPVYNERLSKKRAQEVSEFLVNNTKIDNDSTFIMGAGYRKPIAENKTTEGRKTNRRIDIVFDSVIN